MDKPVLLGQINELTILVRSALEFGHAPEAIKCAQHKHELILQVFGETGKSTGTSLIDLGRAYALAGRARAARQGYGNMLLFHCPDLSTSGEISGGHCVWPSRTAMRRTS